ncbi:MAG: hypothetical protein NZ899_11815 [Thermoguttaceae bacterium]|nr:hypothetical protein [Thermoguttaceae bacterium]MDW8079365.1 galactokinase family protein [Thermoguttaceae bacterium]
MLRRWEWSGSWDDRDALTNTLVQAGLTPPEAERKARLFAEAAAAIPAGQPAVGFFVPGRVEVLGKHTDYAGGQSIVAPIERGFCLVALARPDRRVFLTNVDSAEVVSVELSGDLVPVQGHWLGYPMTVVRRVVRNFPGIDRGAEIAFASDLPPAAGMSSSSAFMVAVFLALAELNAIDQHPAWEENINSLEDLAGYLATVENGQNFGSLAGDRGVGTQGGSEDHTAILLGRAGQLLRYRYVPVDFVETIPLPPEWVFAIAASGVVAEKTGAALEKYNAASFRARELARLWQEVTGRGEATLGAITDCGPAAVDELRRIISTKVGDPAERELLRARLEHFVLENQEVLPQAADALRAGDFERFGQLVDRSQWGAENLLGNQVPETSFLARSARELDAVAASAFGAGFGGAVWALVRKDQAEDFLGRWSAAYCAQFPHRLPQAHFFLTRPGPAAFVLRPGP